MKKYYAGCASLPVARLEELDAIRTNHSAEEPLLKIRPLISANEQVFRVKYQPINTFLKEEGLDHHHYLLITTPGVYRAVIDQLVGSYTCIYVFDSKMETLQDIQALYDATVASQQKDSFLPEEVVQQNRDIRDEVFEAVVCMGGGVGMDAGKYISSEVVHAPLYAIPTVLSVNAAFCYKAAVREPDPYKDGAYNVVYKFYGLPQAICVDLEVITSEDKLQAAKDSGDENAYEAVRNQWSMLRELNIAGAGDLLSILTATYDWRINSLVARDMCAPDPVALGKSVLLEKPFSQDVCEGAMELLALLAEHADEIRGGTKEGAKFLARAYHWIAEQSWVMQHTMWESASEHGMFDHFENLAGTELTHGQVIALSVYFMSLLQEYQHDRVLKMIERLGLEISLADLAANGAMNYKIAPITLYDCLVDLKKYIDEIAYRYTVISAKPISKQWVLDALDKYYADVYDRVEQRYLKREELFEDKNDVHFAERRQLEKIIHRVTAQKKAHEAAMEAARTAEAEAKKSLAEPQNTLEYNKQLAALVDIKADEYASYLRELHNQELASVRN